MLDRRLRHRSNIGPLLDSCMTLQTTERLQLLTRDNAGRVSPFHQAAVMDLVVT